jgi:hypothetical protein
MFARSDFYFILQLPLIIIHITCISLSLCRTSAPIHVTSVLGVLGTQETSCVLIAGLLERDTFDLFLSKFDKPWVIHLRETCCCFTNLYTWRPNTVYNNRSVRRHQALFWHRCRGERGFLQLESLTSNLFYFVIVFLSLFTLFLFASFYQKYKNNSSFYSCYFCLSVLVLLG